jgi:predicted dehydrogenase
MLPEMGPPKTERWEWTSGDASWSEEVREFATALAERRRPIGDIEDALSTMALIERIYRERRP